MRPLKAYLLKAYYEYIAENNLTAVLFFNIYSNGVIIPDAQFGLADSDGEIDFELPACIYSGVKISTSKQEPNISHYDYLETSNNFYIPIKFISSIGIKELGNQRIEFNDVLYDQTDQNIELALKETNHEQN